MLITLSLLHKEKGRGGILLTHDSRRHALIYVAHNVRKYFLPYETTRALSCDSQWFLISAIDCERGLHSPSRQHVPHVLVCFFMRGFYVGLHDSETCRQIIMQNQDVRSSVK